ncbi:MAG: TRAP transporter permease [Opitutales bacterium]|nr:TRAP transporter permease [Opitutales bacterium]
MEDTPSSQPTTPPWLNRLYGGAAFVFFSVLVGYYVSGFGGPTQLAVIMVPLALIVGNLRDLRAGEIYPRLPAIARHVLVGAQVFVCLAAALYIRIEFDAIRSTRLGAWTPLDYLAGTALALLVLEYTRRRYFPVFLINLILVLYCVYGAAMPGMLRHPGISWQRVGSSLSLEMSTGIFERLPQLGLTLIGSFLLLLAALRAFGGIDSLLRGSARMAAKSPRLLPQAAVVGSLGVAAVSGSGAANAATTGSATIPLFIRAGFPRAHAAAVETAASLGGQLMPPLMGIAAFIMAEMMMVSYGEVMLRGFVPAFIYFTGVSLAVYLLSARFQKGKIDLPIEPMGRQDFLNIAAYGTSVAALVFLMGVVRWPAMVAAQYVFTGLLLFFTITHAYGLIRQRCREPRLWIRPYGRLIGNFAATTSELTLLLASLGILTAAFTITGVPDKLGVLLLQLAEFNVFLMILTAFAFGYLIGMGLPVTPTYIVLAIVTVPFMVRAGIDPWVAHFFAFFVAVFGELSPPTSVTAAVTSRIANASFLRTMLYALGLCSPLIVLMAGIFTRPELIAQPGWQQIPAAIPVIAVSAGILLCLYGGFSSDTLTDRVLRLLTLAGAVALLFVVATLPSIILSTLLLCMAFHVIQRSRRLNP